MEYKLQQVSSRPKFELKTTIEAERKAIEDKAGMYGFMLFIFLQLADDTIVELFNLPQFKGKFKWEKAKIKDEFRKLRMRSKRALTSRELEYMDDVVCYVTDLCTPHLDYIKNMARTEFAQKMPYNQIEGAVYLGTTYGCIRAAQRLNQLALHKNLSGLEVIADALGDMCDNAGFHGLNKDIEIKENYCAEGWTKLIEKVKTECIKYTTKK